MNNFTALNEETRKEMLESISKSNIDELFEEIPQKARMQSLDLPNALNEMQTQRVVKGLAKANNSDYIYFDKVAVITAYRTKSSNKKIFVIMQIMCFLIVEIGYDTLFKITVRRESV